MGKFFQENRIPVFYEDLGDNLVNALIATEDIRYYNHSGIDFRGVMRSLFLSVVLQRDAGFASTVSQQLARNLFEMRYDERFSGSLYKVPVMSSFIIKLKEWMVAIKLERSYTKEEILYMFLNTLSYSNNVFGVKVASNTYFNKEPNELDIHEAALLVGVINNQTLFNPIRRPDNALGRRNRVISQMEKYGFISQEQKDFYTNKELDINYEPDSHNQGTATYFRTEIRKELRQWAAENNINLYNSGLRIYTTLDPTLQRYAERAVKDHMKYIQDLFDEHWKDREPWTDGSFQTMDGYADRVMRRTSRYKQLVERYGKGSDSVNIVLNTPRPMRVHFWEDDPVEGIRMMPKEVEMSPMDSLRHYQKFLHAGFMVMDPRSGEIKAWVGGVNHSAFQFDHVRQGKNQPGSTFKPILYATAIDLGYSPCYPLLDQRLEIKLPNGDVYSPNNSTKTYDDQRMTIRQAMARSVNRIAVMMLQELQADNVIGMARRLGIKSDLLAVPSLALGTSDVSIYEMVAAYSTFVNKGTYTEPIYITKIEDKNGTVLMERVPRREDVLSEEAAYLMTYMLRGATEESGGTATGLHPDLLRDNEMGGKTGTTSNYADGWFMGITHNLVGGIWVGGDANNLRFRTIRYGQGAVMAMPIWEKFMLQVYRDPSVPYKKGSFPKPRRPLTVTLDCSVYETNDSTQVDTLLPELPEL
ncbi:MAG: transglycosylase domain-containing protein [Bacteroidota bacterium]